MFCSNCGREGKEGELFCGGCGLPKGQNVVVQPVQTVSNQPIQNMPVQPVQPTKKKMPTWAKVLIIVGSVLLAFVLCVVGLFTLLIVSFSNYEEEIYAQTDSFVYVDGDEIPTIYEIIGEYDMCDYPNYESYDGIDYITYSYCDDYFDDYVLNDYLDYLIEGYGFEEYDKSSSFRSVIIQSNEIGYYVVVKAYIYGEYVEYYRIKEEDREYNVDNGI